MTIGPLQFLIRSRGKRPVAHLWTGDDTACRMASTGGLKLERYFFCEFIDDFPICEMCGKKSDFGAGNPHRKPEIHSREIHTTGHSGKTPTTLDMLGRGCDVA